MSTDLNKKLRDPGCTGCKLHKTADYVCLLGQGPNPNKVMIVGEAPGKREDQSGKPFVGDAGQLLIKALKEYGFDRDNCFITNAVSCRPPGNRAPKPAEIKACKFWVDKQLDYVKPKFVLLLGNTPLQSLLGLKGIKKKRGKPIIKDGIIYVPTYHPAFILRDPRQMELFKADIELFATIVSKGKLPEEEGLNYTIVNDQFTLDKMLEALWGSVSFDIETTTLYPWLPEARLNSLGFGTRKDQWLIPTDEYENTEYDKGVKYGWTRKRIIEILTIVKKRIEDGELKLTGQNGKFDSLYTWVRYGVRLDMEFDTMMASFMLDENELSGLKHTSKVYYGAPTYDVDDDIKFGKKGFLPLAHYQAHDLYYTRKLKFKFLKKLKQDPEVYQVFQKIIMPCVNLFTEVEHRGVYLDLSKMDEAERFLRKMKAEAEAELMTHLPKGYGDINWGSTKQLGKLLFEVLKIPIVQRTKKGAPSTSESVLKQIDHDMVGALLKFREAKQQLSFFIDGWKPYIENNRLHPSFKLNGTVTGRLSCEHPNLQQVPRDPRIRSLITAPPGWVLLEADLSQIELRIAAELSNDRGLVHAFLTGLDPHWLTAMREIERGGAMKDLVLKTATAIQGEKVKNYGDACIIILKAGYEACEVIDPIWKELRKKAKAVNFGYLYGMWWKKFKIYARDNYGVKVTDEQAQASRTNYFITYPDLSSWHKRQKRYAREHGYVASLSGRKRRLPAAMSRDDTPERGAAERQAINSPVQSFANDLNLMAAIQLRAEFSTRVLYIVGTVHDALLMEVREDYVERVHNRTLEIMRQPKLLEEMDISLKIPIDAEAKIGPWASGVKLAKWLKENPQ